MCLLTSNCSGVEERGILTAVGAFRFAGSSSRTLMRRCISSTSRVFVSSSTSLRWRASFRSSVSTPAWIRAIGSVLPRLNAGASAPAFPWSLTVSEAMAASALTSSLATSNALTASHTGFTMPFSTNFAIKQCLMST